MKNEKVPLTRDRVLTIIRERIIARIDSPMSCTAKEIEKIVLEEHSKRNGLPPESGYSIYRRIISPALLRLKDEGRAYFKKGWEFYPEYQRRFGPGACNGHLPGAYKVYLFYNPRDKQDAESEGKDIWACHIGSTSRPVEEWIREQTDQWTIPPVIALVFRDVIEEWSLELERRIHNILKMFGRRRDALKGRELFDTSPDEVVRIYELINKMELDTDRLDPENAITYYNRGCAYIEKDEYNKAIADFHKSVLLDPGNADTYFERGRAYYKKGEYDSAIGNFDKSVDLDPGNADTYFERGRAYYKKGEYRRAIENLDIILRLDPEYSQAYTVRIYAYRRMYNEVKKIFVDVSDFRGVFYQDMCNEVLDHNFSSAYDESIRLYDESIQLDPEDAYYYCQRADSYRKTGDYDRAIEDYNAAIQLEPEDAITYYNRALIYHYHIGDYDKAIEDYNAAIQLEPEDAITYYNRALIYHYHIGDYDKAIEDYNAAIQFNPENLKDFVYSHRLRYASKSWNDLARTYHYRGNLYHYHIGDYDKAIEDYNAAIRITPGVAVTHLNRGYAYDNKGDYDKAIKDYDNAVRLCPDYEFDFFDAGQIYSAKDALEKIIERLDSMINAFSGSADAYYYTGVKALLENDGLSAKRAFTLAQREGYNDPSKIDQHLANLKY